MKVKAILNSGYFANTRHATNYIAYIDRQSPIFDQNGTEKGAVRTGGSGSPWQQHCMASCVLADASDCERLGVDRNYMKKSDRAESR